MLAEGKVNAAPIATGNVGLPGVEAAFDMLAVPGKHAKIIIEPASPATEPVAASGGKQGGWTSGPDVRSSPRALFLLEILPVAFSAGYPGTCPYAVDGLTLMTTGRGAGHESAWYSTGMNSRCGF